MFSRRDLGKLALVGLPMSATAAKKIDSVVHGVQFGLQSYVFSGIGSPQDGVLDVVVKSMVESGLGECDLYAPLVEPAQFWGRIRAGGPAGPGASVPPEVAAARAQAREELAKWRMTVSLDYFRPIRKKFEGAGIEIYGLSGFPGSTEKELGRTFEIAEVLGSRLVTLGVTLSAAKRVAPLAEKRGFLVGIQGRPDMGATNPDLIAKPENFETAVSLSKSYRMSFDIGDATGGGYDSLKFVEAHHDRIALLYLKDRRKDRLSVPWGEGDTPIKEILRLIGDRKYPIRCYIDCDYKTANRPADVKRSFEYATAALG
ncbi:MAG: sugar phosphate isomerase/epimerase family protein [Bryobacteraceae bacterium]